MKKIQIITLIIATLILGGCSSKKENLTPQTQALLEDNATQSQLTSLATIEDDNTTVAADANTTTVEDTNTTQQVVEENNATVQNDDKQVPQQNRTYTLFEKKFINHLAYNHYEKAIKLLYEKNNQEAYAEAMQAKEVYDNELKEEKTIELPYIPGYIRQSAQTPKRIYYKIVKKHIYELKRLIRKIKLLNPPIPFVVINKTSTYIEVSVKNYGDTPLDNLVVEINYEQVAVFAKINPGDTKTVRYNKTMDISQISFSEDYGFAPSPIEFAQKEEE